ncbi:TIGR02217 family protein [Shinella sp. BYT-45]|uniref:phage distal tail protein, Rcc01695 family n=1 Tax=Shinella sp. BYT-45 TaxID=3377377 RepID=UPI00397ECCCB
MAGFHEVRFPLRVALGTSGGPVRRTDIVSLSNGRENRNRRWQDARRRYDAGSGVRSLDDLYAVLAFFEARAGQFFGFRFRDPVDHKSCAPSAAIGAQDQFLGAADGATATFQLVKRYADAGGETVRRIDKPVAGTVAVSVAGMPVPAADYTVDAAAGTVTFKPGKVPASGAVRAGFEFDVPVRFDTDRIDIDLAQFDAGRIPSIPLVEIKP